MRIKIDSKCIDCGKCVDHASNLFERNAATGVYYVRKQPTTEAEIKKAYHAILICPVSAIHTK